MNAKQLNEELFDAVKKGELEKVERLIKNNSTKVDVMNNFGETPLMIATMNGNYEMAKLLINSGANVNFKDCAGWSLLFRAINNHRKEIVELLINSGANLEEKLILFSKDKQVNEYLTPLMFASSRGYTDIVELLIEKFLRNTINAQNRLGLTALDYSTNLEVTSILRKYGGKYGREL